MTGGLAPGEPARPPLTATPPRPAGTGQPPRLPPRVRQGFRDLTGYLAKAYVSPLVVGYDYNRVLGPLWLSIMPGGRLPTGEEFEATVAKLCDMLREAALPGGRFVGREDGEKLRAAHHLLCLALDEACRIGLLSGTRADASAWD